MKKLLILILLSYSCQNKFFYKDNFVITIDSIISQKIVKLPTRWECPLNVQFKNDSIVFVNFYPEYSTIYVIDVNSSKILDSISFKNFHIKYFNYINSDSLLIYAHDYNEDSIIYKLYLVDTKGKLLFTENLTKKLKGCKSAFSERYYDKCLIDNFFYYKHNLYFSIMYSNGAAFAKLNLKSMQIQFYDNITYPDFNKNMPKDEINYYHVNLFPLDNQLIISFNYTPKIYILNMENNEVSKKIIKSNIENENIRTKYYGPFYKINDTLYGRFVLMENEQFEYQNIILLNKKISYLGESYFENTNSFFWYYPTQASFNMVISNENYYFVKSYLKFKKVKLTDLQQRIYEESNKRKQKQESICKLLNKSDISNINDKQILSYIKNILNIKDTSFAMIVLNEKGCSSCNSYVEEFLENNKNFFSNFTNIFYTLYVYQTPKFRKKIIKGIKIITDTTKTYEYVHPFNSYNPRLIIIEKNKIISDTIYLPEQLNLMIKRILNFYDIQINN